MFFQVSWIRCHIVRIQGKKERKKKSRDNRWQIANFDNFWLTAVFFTAKVAFWRAWMRNKVTTHQIKEEKLEIFASVSYRSNTGEEWKRRNLVKTGGKLLTLTILWLTAVFFAAKVAFWRAGMKNEVTTHHIRVEKFEICASQGRKIGVFFQVSWIRCHIGRIQRDMPDMCPA